MTPATRDDFLWLMSDAAAPILTKTQVAFESRLNAVRIAKTLRKETTPERSALVMEQAQLRIRARKKFSRPGSMFFTRRGLEQASGKLIAQYKARRFADHSNVADVCCGIGGDLIALGKRQLKNPELSGDGRTVGVDSDELTCLFARRNFEVLGLDPNLISVQETEFEKFDFKDFDGIHIDPDRRVKGKTVLGNRFSPNLQSVFEAASKDCSLAIKVAPATPFSNYFPAGLEREWIGDHRECKQQILWQGRAARNPGFRSATYIGRDGKISRISIDELELKKTVAVFDSIHRFIYEPHAAVLAAKLTDAIAEKYDIARFTSSLAYLTADHEVDDPLLARFEVLQILPMSLRQTVKALNALDVGQIEVKKRGIENVAKDQYDRLKLKGPNKATVMLTRLGKTRIVVIAKREGNDLTLPTPETLDGEIEDSIGNESEGNEDKVDANAEG